jgi:hypothetical protein
MDGLDTSNLDSAGLDFLRSTLAWQQLDESGRETIAAIAVEVGRVYATSPVQARQRWAKSGASLASAVVLEGVARELAAEPFTEDQLGDPIACLDRLLSGDRLELLLSLQEAPRAALFDGRGGRRTQVEVDLKALCLAWVDGAEMAQLGSDFLGEVPDLEFRAEQLGDLIGGLFESFLPWVLGEVITWTNAEREASRTGPLSTDIPLLLKWGVPDVEAASLLLRGLTSRTLSVRLVREWADDTEKLQDIIDWLRQRGIASLRASIVLGYSETLQVLELVRVSGLLASVVAGGQASFDVELEPDLEVSRGRIRLVMNDESLGVNIVQGGRSIGRVADSHVSDALSLLDTGLSIDVRLEVESGQGHLVVRLEEPQE